MKNMSTKKKVFVASIAVCLVAILSMGTLAWFTASDSVTNDFYFGTTDEDGDELFAIDVWEDDEADDPDNDDRDYDGLQFDHVVPNQPLYKEPHLENKGQYSQFVRATVIIEEASVLASRFEKDWNDPSNMLEGINDTDWKLGGVKFVKGGEDRLEYTFYYEHILEPDTSTSEIFNTVRIPKYLTDEEAREFGEDFTVTIYGEAIQSEYLEYEGNPIDNAYDAFLYLVDGGLSFDPNQDAEVYEGEIADTVVVTDPAYMVIDDSFKSTGTAISLQENGTNSTVMLYGGDYTLANDEYVVEVDSASMPVVVYVCGTFTVNGVEITSAAAAAPYFSNVTLIWMF